MEKSLKKLSEMTDEIHIVLFCLESLESSQPSEANLKDIKAFIKKYERKGGMELMRPYEHEYLPCLENIMYQIQDDKINAFSANFVRKAIKWLWWVYEYKPYKRKEQAEAEAEKNIINESIETSDEDYDEWDYHSVGDIVIYNKRDEIGVKEEDMPMLYHLESTLVSLLGDVVFFFEQFDVNIKDLYYKTGGLYGNLKAYNYNEIAKELNSFLAVPVDASTVEHIFKNKKLPQGIAKLQIEKDHYSRAWQFGHIAQWDIKVVKSVFGDDIKHQHNHIKRGMGKGSEFYTRMKKVIK